jgi:hypothetical protein
MNTHSISPALLVPMQFRRTQFGYSALLDDDDNEQPITEAMIHAACEEASDALYWCLPESVLSDVLDNL